MVPNERPEVDGWFVPSAIEISGTLDAVQGFFSDANTTLRALGKRSKLPLPDITAEVEAVLGK